MSSSINPDEPFLSPSSQEVPEGAAVESNTNPATSDGGKNPANISAPENWRDIALRIENEKDPARVIELAQQLIDMIDQGKLAKAPDRVPISGHSSARTGND
jgi:hypothetical protein